MHNANATRQEAAAFLRVSQGQLRRWEGLKIGPPVMRISPRKALYPWEGLRAFLASSTGTPERLKAALIAELEAEPLPTIAEVDAELSRRITLEGR